MSFILLALCGIGLLSLTVFFPLLAWIARFVQRVNTVPETAVLPLLTMPAHVEILLPAHNEEILITATLTSVQRSAQYLQGHLLPLTQPLVRVHVGADACSDGTAAIARGLAVRVTEFPDNRSKWLTLKSLCMESTADWVIFVDAGTVWPEDFLEQLLVLIRANPGAMALSPSYTPMKAGIAQRVVWALEICLKRLEGLSGGPVSVHGATVAYRTEAVKKAFEHLGDSAWLNDDVVLPLALRTLYPNNTVLYPAGNVQDIGVSHDKSDLNRRKRMVLGNLQWVKALLPHCLYANPVAGLLALRRVGRIFWAYWAGLGLVGVAWQLNLVVPSAVLLAVGIAFSSSLRHLAEAAFASLMAPVRVLLPNRELQGVWK